MQDWYKKSFNLDYLKVYSHRNNKDALKAINFIEEELPLQKDHLILDLCCGSGRHSINLSNKGYTCIGYDLSEQMLFTAWKESIDNKISLNLIRGDMRHLPFKNTFDVVLNLFTSFGYFDDDEDNQQVIREVSTSLKKDGMFVMDYINREHVFNNLVSKSSRKLENGWFITEDRSLDKENNKIIKEITISKEDNTAKYHEVLKVYDFETLASFFKNAGLEITKVFGDFNGEEYDNISSKRLIIFSKKL